MRVAVVDDHNRFLRWEERHTVHALRLPHRSVHVLVFHPDGGQRLLAQQRHPQKLTYPGFWDVACAGHVEADDYTAGPDDDLDAVYAAVARRELSEELGISPPLTWLGALTPTAGVHYEQAHLFACVHPGPFTLQPSEVSAVAWVTPQTLTAWDADGLPVTPMLHHLCRWLTAHNRWPSP